MSRSAITSFATSAQLPRGAFSRRARCAFIPLLALGLASGSGVIAATPDETVSPQAIDLETLLPPEIPWQGRSLSLVAAEDDIWRTPIEDADFETTPTYAETFAWIDRIVAAAPELQKTSLGRSWEGRDIWMVIASSEGASTPEELDASGKPVLLAQGGIHAGEIDGKDAGMIFLRELVFGRYRDLLDHASLLFVPILNVDGHERISPLSRVNQRGPEESGWRTNARNLNLNRDYSKLDTPEISAVVAAINRWHPDLYLDLHVTDGIEQQPDITWSFTGPHGHSPAISAWLESRFDQQLAQDLTAMGHIPGPHVFVIDRNDLGKGVLYWEGGPRYSDGYGSARHLPTVLVENHSLKPYRQRVLGTMVLLASALGTLGDYGQELATAITADSSQRPDQLVLGWGPANQPERQTHRFLGIESLMTRSSISGDISIEWTGNKIEVELPKYLSTRPLGTAILPQAYWVPSAWGDIIDRLERHGVEMEILTAPHTVTVEQYRLGAPKVEVESFEGHYRIEVDVHIESRAVEYPPGSARISTDQPLGILAALLLEPEAPDSFLRWGFFASIFQRTEYAEAYVLEPLAEQMLEQDPDLAAEFEAKLESEPDFAASPTARLDWFYQRSPLVDPQWRLYPIGREMRAD
ncbi:MAG: M14 family metallopeptidase [Acidobacteriota bacterium]